MKFRDALTTPVTRIACCVLLGPYTIESRLPLTDLLPLASGENATDAYELAGYKRNGGNGPAMARTMEIKDRVTEINEERLGQERQATAIATERAAITKQSLIEMARDIYVQARKDGQNAAAVAALKELGVLTGYRIERRESGAPGEFAEIENMTAEELEAFIAGEFDIETYRQGKSSQAVN
jgi:hypothetical protein